MLKKKKADLLKAAGLKSANLAALRARRAEEDKLEAEIKALKNPASARRKDAVRSASKSFFGAVARTSRTFVNNAARLEKERKERARAERIQERDLEIAKLKASRRRKSPTKKKSKKKATRKKRRK